MCPPVDLYFCVTLTKLPLERLCHASSRAMTNSEMWGYPAQTLDCLEKLLHQRVHSHPEETHEHVTSKAREQVLPSSVDIRICVCVVYHLQALSCVDCAIDPPGGGLHTQVSP